MGSSVGTYCTLLNTTFTGFLLSDEPRVPGGARPDLFIGPARDRRQLLEVMVEVQPPTDLFIFHAMPARQKIIDIAERNAK